MTKPQTQQGRPPKVASPEIVAKLEQLEASQIRFELLTTELRQAAADLAAEAEEVKASGATWLMVAEATHRKSRQSLRQWMAHNRASE